MPKALYPGTFDPITLGHVDILKRALRLFDAVEVAVIAEPSKSTLLSTEERIALVRRAVHGWKQVSVEPFEGLLVRYARARDIDVLIRGLRQSSDFVYEYQMAVANRKMQPELETVCLMTSSEYSFISSTLVREIYQHGGDLSPFVPEAVRRGLEQKQQNGRIAD